MLGNRFTLSASQAKEQLLRGTFLFNNLRYVSTLSDKSHRHDFPASPLHDDEPRAEQKTYDPFIAWALDEIDFYILECLQSLCIGCKIRVSLSAPNAIKAAVSKEGEEIVLSIGDRLEAESYLPAWYDFADDEERYEFYASLCDEIMDSLSNRGYSLAFIDPMGNEYENAPVGTKFGDIVFEGMKDMGRFAILVKWADESYADACEKIIFDSQLEACLSGIDIADITRGQTPL